MSDELAAIPDKLPLGWIWREETELFTEGFDSEACWVSSAKAEKIIVLITKC